MKKKWYQKLSVQLGLSITVFICIIEMVLLYYSYLSKCDELKMLDKQVVTRVEQITGKNIGSAFSENEIQERLDRFTFNVSVLILIIIACVVSGTLFIFYHIANKHIFLLAKLENETTLHNLALYPESEIPNNELGDVIKARNKSLKAIQMSTARISILSDIAAGISHEINTPLNVIHGNAQLIQMDLMNEKPNLEKAINKLQIIDSIVFKIGKIVKGIKALSRDADDEDMENVNLVDILNEVAVFNDEKIKSLHVNLTIDYEDSELEIEGRSFQLFQALTNLVKNSCDSISDQEEKWIKLSVQKTNRNVVEITVTDSGNGIPKEIREKIMTPYFTTKKVGEGTGLGLGFAKTIFEQHKGSILIDTENKNTSFKINLPIKQNIKELRSA
jgi:signal transduction histidine kinase